MTNTNGPSFEELVKPIEKDIHDVIMFLKGDRREDELPVYSHKYGIDQVTTLFSEHRHYNVTNYKLLYSLKLKIEEMLSFLLNEESAQKVFSRPDLGDDDFFIPLYEITDNPDLAKAEEVTKFLQRDHFKNLIIKINRDYITLTTTLSRLEFDLEDDFDNSELEKNSIVLSLRQKLLITLYLQDENLFPRYGTNASFIAYKELYAALFDSNEKDVGKKLSSAEKCKSGPRLTPQQKKDCTITLQKIRPFFTRLNLVTIEKAIYKRIEELGEF